MPIFFTTVKKYSVKSTDSISRLLVASPNIIETRAISGTDIRDMEVIRTTKNETAALASGGFGSSYEGSSSGGSKIVTKVSIANDSCTSSDITDVVDNRTKPPEGIEPSESKVTILLPHPADGVFSFYHAYTYGS